MEKQVAVGSRHDSVDGSYHDAPQIGYTAPMKIKRNQFKVIASFLLLTFLVVVIISTALYYNSSKTLKDQSAIYYSTMMAQMERSLEHVLNEVNSTIISASLDSDLYDYAELSENREWFRIHRINEKISSLIAASEAIQSIHIYYKIRGKVLSNTKGLMEESAFFDQDALKEAENLFFYPGWRGPRMILNESFLPYKDYIKVLTVVRPLGQVRNFNHTFIIVNIHWDYIQKIALSLGFEENIYLYLAKKNVDFIPFKETNPLISEDLLLRGDATVEIQGKDYLKVRQESSNGWIFYSLVPNELLLKDIRKTLNYTLIISFFSLSLGILLSFFLSFRIQKPITQLLGLFTDSSEIQDELSYISERARNLLEEKETLNSRIMQNHDQLKSYFLNQLLSARTDQISSLKQKLRDIDFEIDFDSPYFLMLSYRKGQEAPAAFIGNNLTQFTQYRFSLPGGFTLIVSNTPRNYCMNKIRKILTNRPTLGEGVYTGISNMAFGIEMFPKAYYQCKRALDQTLSRPGESCFFFDSIDIEEKESVRMPALSFSLETCIKNQFKSKDVSPLMDTIRKNIYNIMASSVNNPEILRYHFFQVTNIILEAFSESGGKINDFFQSIDIYDLLFSPMSPEEYLDLLENSIYLLLQKLDNQESNQIYIVKKAQEYISSHLSEDLSVQTIASAVYLSRSHLSHLFQEITKENIKDFIIKGRMKKAKDLLTDENLHVKDISLAVGYENVQSFIRLFKKLEGVTPGEYRRRLPI